MGKFSCMNESKKIEMKKKVFFYMKTGDSYFLTSTYLPDNNNVESGMIIVACSYLTKKTLFLRCFEMF